MMGIPLLTAVIFSPLLGVFLLAFTGNEAKKLAKTITLLSALLTLLFSLILYFQFDTQRISFQFVERVNWVKEFEIHYFIGIDGISLFLVLLTSMLTATTILGTWNCFENNLRPFLICVLLVETGLLGAFSSLDVFLFFVFWETIQLPMFFMIGLWGGENRTRVSLYFYLYSLAGSLFVLIGILSTAIFHQNTLGRLSFSLLDWYEIAPSEELQNWFFMAFVVGFFIKIPLFPFHTWHSKAIFQSPIPGIVLLSGLMGKVGVYGLLRFALPLFPDAARSISPYLMVFSVVGTLYCAFIACIQPNLKSLLAYFSLSHLGLIMLGVFSLSFQGIQGSILQMINHGIIFSGLFLGIGMLVEREKTDEIEYFKGLIKVMPFFSLGFIIISLSSIGVPGSNGFIGMFTILLGAFPSNPLITSIAAAGILVFAVTILWMNQRIFWGPNENPKTYARKDINIREAVVLLPLILLIFLMGLYPKPFFSRTENAVIQMLEKVNSHREPITDYLNGL